MDIRATDLLTTTASCEACGAALIPGDNECPICGWSKPLPRKIVYTLSVEVSQALREDGDECDDFPTLAWAVSQKARTEIEKAVIACLRRLEQECVNVEVMDWTVEEDV